MSKTIKFYLIFTLLHFVFAQSTSAMTIEDGKQAFQNYVKYSNACNRNLIGMYDKNSSIKRIVINKDGSSYIKILPVGMYKTMLLGYSKAALLQGYSNVYTNVSFYQCGDDVMVKALRHPSTSRERLPATIVFHQNAAGNIVIKEEIFHTNASFLLK